MNLVVFRFDPSAEGSVCRGQWSEPVDAREVYDAASFEKWEPEAQAWLKVRAHREYFGCQRQL